MKLMINKTCLEIRPLHTLLQNPSEYIFLMEKSVIAGKNHHGLKIITVDDINDDDTVIRKVLLELNDKNYIFSDVVSCTEKDQLLASRLREVLSVKRGFNSSNILAFRNKGTMRDVFSQCNSFKTPKYKLIYTFEEIECYINEIDFPVVTKPIDGSGSRGVVVHNNRNEFQEYIEIEELSNILPLLIEEHINLPMVHVDGIYSDGGFIVFNVSKYSSDCLAHVRGEHLSSYTLSENDELSVRCKKSIEEIISLTIFDDKPFMFHAEFFYSENDLYLCEIGSRPGGGPIIPQLNKLYDFNYTQLYFNLHESNCEYETPVRKDLVSSWVIYSKEICEKSTPLIDKFTNENVSWLFNHKVNVNSKKADSSIDFSFSCNFICSNKQDYEIKLRKILTLLDSCQKNIEIE